ncbi:type II toxin-antitoxin system PemK/MazF family toxin [bacterium]|nr:type II toxin-antitoxin system PemK/MazF family toxin [bacterium]
MITEGQIVLFKFPQTNQSSGKLRPALVLRKMPGKHDDWLICMISSQLSQQIPDYDELLDKEDAGFDASGLIKSSVIRIGRLAVVEGSILLGAIGKIEAARLTCIKLRLSNWIRGENTQN